MKEENWKPIIGYEGKYDVSDYGRVRKSNGKILTPKPANNGYLRSTYGMDRDYTHRLVAKHFVPNPNHYPEVNHIDGNKHNNHYSNLEWCTRKQNCEHASRTGLINKNSPLRKQAILANRLISVQNAQKPVLQIDDANRVVAEYPSVMSASLATGVKAQNISQVAHGCKYRIHAGGYRWQYK